MYKMYIYVVSNPMLFILLLHFHKRQHFIKAHNLITIYFDSRTLQKITYMNINPILYLTKESIYLENN